MRIVLTAFAFLALAIPVSAQEIDFGDNTSQWANDQECDDMRFEGPGMTTTILLGGDIGHDAADCQAAFEAGNLVLAQSVAQSVTETMAETSAGTVTATLPGISGDSKTLAESVRGAPGVTLAENLLSDGVQFGDDSGQWANDGECDDRRFFGAGMAGSISWGSLARDATDCAAAYQAGTARLWSLPEAKAATQCSAIDFGDDFGEYANDNECDDYRFEGRGVAMHLDREDIGHDATDCQRLCNFGVLALRDY